MQHSNPKLEEAIYKLQCGDIAINWWSALLYIAQGSAICGAYLANHYLMLLVVLVKFRSITVYPLLKIVFCVQKLLMLGYILHVQNSIESTAGTNRGW